MLELCNCELRLTLTVVKDPGAFYSRAVDIFFLRTGAIANLRVLTTDDVTRLTQGGRLASILTCRSISASVPQLTRRSISSAMGTHLTCGVLSYSVAQGSVCEVWRRNASLLILSLHVVFFGSVRWLLRCLDKIYSLGMSQLLILYFIAFILKTSLDILSKRLVTCAVNDLFAIKLFRLQLFVGLSVQNWRQVVFELWLVIGTLFTIFVDALAFDPGTCHCCRCKSRGFSRIVPRWRSSFLFRLCWSLARHEPVSEWALLIK